MKIKMNGLGTDWMDIDTIALKECDVIIKFEKDGIVVVGNNNVVSYKENIMLIQKKGLFYRIKELFE